MVKEAIAELKKQAVANGRDPNSLEISLLKSRYLTKKTIEEMETEEGIRIIFNHFRTKPCPSITHP